MENSYSTEIKVGLFVILALFVGGIIVFLIGSSSQMFEGQATLYTAFARVSGLKVGSQVRLSGLKIGLVDRIWIGKIGKLPVSPSVKRALASKQTSKGPMILVRMKVASSKLPYIREDSTAHIKTKGLLGDALIEISIGTEGKSAQPGGFIPGITPKSLSEFMAEGGTIISSLKRSLLSIESILEQYRDPSLSKSLKGIASSIDSILKRVAKGPGSLHTLIYSPELARNLRRILAQTHALLFRLTGVTRQLQLLLARAQRPGTLVHALALSPKEGKKFTKNLQQLLQNLKTLTGELNAVISSAQTPGTLLYKVLKDKDSSKLITNLVKSTDYLKSIMADIRAGKGTLGALINDPTAFEDFKTILGQVKRSRIFRALIRFIIKRNDKPVNAGRIKSQ